MSRGGAYQERKEEVGKPDRTRLLPLEPENDRIELGAGKKRQDDRADPGEKLDPDSSVPRIAEPTAAPMMSWAMVPTTISERAVEIRNQIESRLATSARPSHSAASAHTPVMTHRSGRGSSQAYRPEKETTDFATDKGAAETKGLEDSQ
jgi:hypothetical protein